MSTLPDKWIQEQKMKLNINLGSKMVETLTALVESKNVAYHIEKNNSKPIDLAIVPTKPIWSNVFLFMLLGGIFGGVITILLAMFKNLAKGLKVSVNNLELAGQHVAGKFSDNFHNGLDFSAIDDKDLNILRSLVAHFYNAKRILLVTGNGFDYSKYFAYLISKIGFSVLVIRCTDGHCTDSGLLQYLEDNKDPVIHHADGYDVIYGGGSSIYLTELLQSQKYEKLLKSMYSRYSIIVSQIDRKPCDSETKALLPLSDAIALTVSNETIQSLDFYIRSSHNISYLLS